jgi:hypothetical protein
MQRVPLNLHSIRAARGLRAGANRNTVRTELGISMRKMERIESIYACIPDNLLAGIERLLNDREKLRHLISSLLHRNDIFS